MTKEVIRGNSLDDGYDRYDFLEYTTRCWGQKFSCELFRKDLCEKIKSGVFPERFLDPWELHLELGEMIVIEIEESPPRFDCREASLAQMVFVTYLLETRQKLAEEILEIAYREQENER